MIYLYVYCVNLVTSSKGSFHEAAADLKRSRQTRTCCCRGPWVGPATVDNVQCICTLIYIYIYIIYIYICIWIFICMGICIVCVSVYRGVTWVK